MSAITIDFQNISLTTSMSSIIVSNGAIALSASSALSISGTVSFYSLYITTGAINFGVNSGATFNGSIVIPINASGNPTLEVTNFSGMVTVTWPTTSGLQTQTVMPGDPITLQDYAG